MTRELVKVTLRTNPPQTVEGFATACPYFAITPMMGKDWPPEERARKGVYHITHIQTGAKLDSGLKLRESFKVAAALGAIMDWDGDEDVLASRFRNLPQMWQRWARGF